MFVQRLLATALVLATSAEAFAPQLLSTRCQWSRNSRTHLVATFMRKPFITGNWKLNPSTREEAIQLIKGVVAHASDALPDVVVFVPYPFMESIQRVVGDKVCVGAEVSILEVKSREIKNMPNVHHWPEWRASSYLEF